MTSPLLTAHRVGVDALGDYPERIDVRSPAEFAKDHVPGACNHPVLDNSERARIGSAYASSPFVARKMGAALVARNIAAMLESAFIDKPREWQPLVYCWRGGQRSRALTHVLNEVGWRAMQLEGGYRAYRRHVVARLATLPTPYSLVVLCGLTGSGKSRLLTALGEAGAQTLDLEGLARHRGSLLGDWPGDPQPSQKWFESQLLESLQRLDPSQVVFVESESKRIGALQMPESLLERMRAGRGLTLVTPRAQRVALLKDEYRHFLADPAALVDRLQRLTELHGKGTIARWKRLTEAHDWDTLVAELLALHYDPTYGRSLERNFPSAQQAFRIELGDVSAAGFAALAREVLVMSETIQPVES